jgi:mRNA interferase RelE/StbE
LTTYSLEFLPSARREWNKLGADTRKQFARKLQLLLDGPHISSARLNDLPNCYKIKLRSVGYRLVYRVYDDRIVVQVVAVGKRERNEVYKRAVGRTAAKN